MGLDVRASFPITQTRFASPVTGEELRLVYLDHAASTHPPTPVLDAHEEFLRHAYANVHRGAHHLSEVSTEKFEDTRWKIRAFAGARKDDEVIFTHNTTSALNLAAHLMAHVPGHTLVTQLEHHSNDLPHRARSPVVRVAATEDGRLDLAAYKSALAAHKVKLVAVTAASNVTGIMPPLGEVIDLAHRYGARVLVDGAQALAHVPLQLTKWGSTGGPDFFAAPGHKAYAPFGAAFLLAVKDIVEEATPFYPGGGTVRLVTDREVLWSSGAEKQEGGTPNVSGVVALGAAIDFLRAAGMVHVREHEVALARRLFGGLAAIRGVKVLGAPVPVEERVGVASFTVEGVAHGLVSTVLDHEFGVATRNGCFCAHPYLTMLLGIRDNAAALQDRIRRGESTNSPTFPGASRASIGIYNDEADVDRFLEGVRVVAAKKWAGKYLHDGEGWRLDAPNAPKPLKPEI